MWSQKGGRMISLLGIKTPGADKRLSDCPDGCGGIHAIINSVTPEHPSTEEAVPKYGIYITVSRWPQTLIRQNLLDPIEGTRHRHSEDRSSIKRPVSKMLCGSQLPGQLYDS